MLASMAALVRPAALIGVALTILAIAIGRGRSLPEGERHPATPRHHVINGFNLPGTSLDSLLLDSQTGALEPLPGPLGSGIELASCSPWCDERGRTQVVGRWSDWHWQGSVQKGNCPFGLARFTIPDGEMLDRVPLETLPASRLCWFPDTTARVLFAAGDGRLYRYDFDRDGGRPRLLAWRAKVPAPDGLFVFEPTWPADPRLGGRIVASAAIPGRWGTPGPFMRQHLWWIHLDPAGTAIDAAGTLTLPGSATIPRDPEDERLPSLATAPDGSLVLSYVARPLGQTEWQFRLARVAIDPASGDPSVVPETVRTIARGDSASQPLFSPDGRWVYLVLAGAEPAHVVRYDVAEGLGGRPDPAPGPLRAGVVERDPIGDRVGCG
jgi:hypothetical protein